MAGKITVALEMIQQIEEAMTDYVNHEDVDMSVFAEILYKSRDALLDAKAIKPDNEFIADRLTREQGAMIADAMEKFGKLFTYAFGTVMPCGVLGEHFSEFYDDVKTAFYDKVVDEYGIRHDLLESWYYKKVKVVIMRNKGAVVMRGELWRGKNYEDDDGDYVVFNETQRVNFDWSQIQDVVYTLDGIRMVVLHSPHSFIPLPKIESN